MNAVEENKCNEKLNNFNDAGVVRIFETADDIRTALITIVISFRAIQSVRPAISSDEFTTRTAEPGQNKSQATIEKISQNSTLLWKFRPVQNIG